ncbi:hypothetical protein HCN44_004716 [Aphidius gifuensis]|uniref:Uncharacterized protein n=1 Tax=Aphidius gifuensis TaxID=684658 RepID=A0A834Y183_APHGI|nr:hypothetical protein HCN44_004716 [Aphidius gifuensis]
MTFNCGNNNLYLLKSRDRRKYVVPRNLIDILHFNEKNELKTIGQTNDMFDAATSISFDWTTKLLYFSEHRYRKSSIKVTDETFDYRKYIIFPQEELTIEAIEVYPKRGELFFLSGNTIWYTSNSPGSTATLLFSTTDYRGWLTEFSIDYATDILYWIAVSGRDYILHCVNIENTGRPFNKADITKIRRIEVVEESAFNLVAFNNELYWLAYVGGLPTAELTAEKEKGKRYDSKQ